MGRWGYRDPQQGGTTVGQMTELPRGTIRWARPSPSVIGIPAILATWVLFRLASMDQPGYEPMRDTISSLASHGAIHAWIGALGMASAGLATILGSLPLRRISQPAALALGVAGVALFAVTFTRIACPNGAAGCAMGTDTDAATAAAHLAGIALFEVGLVTAIASAALCLWRAKVRWPAVVALIGIILSIAFFALVPVEVGMRQRAWLLVNTVLIAATYVSWIPAPAEERGAAPVGALGRIGHRSTS